MRHFPLTNDCNEPTEKNSHCENMNSILLMTPLIVSPRFEVLHPLDIWTAVVCISHMQTQHGQRPVQNNTGK